MAILMLMLYHLPRVVGPDTYPMGFNNFVVNAFHPFMYYFIVTGYGMYCTYKDGRMTGTYLLKRALRLYITFWLVLGVFVLGIGSWWRPGLFDLSPDIVFANFIGWRWDYSQYTWFMLPYLMVTSCSKWLFKCMERLGYIISLVLGFLITTGMTVLIGLYYESFFCYHKAIYLVVLASQMLMGVTAGAMIARYYLSGHELTWSKLRGKNALLWVLLAVAFLLKGNPWVNSIPYLAVLILWLVLHFTPTKLSQYILIPLGKKSMVMWLAHGFLAVRLFNDFFVMFKWPPLVWLAWILVAFGVACILTPVSDRISKALKLK